MNIRLLRREMKNRSRAGQSYDAISRAYGISKPEVGRIINDPKHYPGPVPAKILGLPAKCAMCKRRIPEKKQKAAAQLDAHVVWWRKLSADQRQQHIRMLYRTLGVF